MAVEKYNQATSAARTVSAADQAERSICSRSPSTTSRSPTTQLQSRAQDIYKTRDVGIVDVLFSSSSFDDLVTQLNMMQRLGNSDVDTVKSIAAYQQDIKDRRVKLEADKKSRRQAGRRARRAEEPGPRPAAARSSR